MFNLCINQQKYSSRTVLQDIHQSYEEEKIHGFLGENGAGKTTMFKCMANFISYDGKRMIPNDVRFGFLPAELYMYPMITGKEFLQFFITAKGLAWNDAEMLKLNNLFELPLGDYADTYSTGMLKKLYLLGLMLQNNDLLLLDEPFNGLDFQSTAFITALLIDYKNKGKTIFIASHEIEHLLDFADTISILRKGSLSFYSDKTRFGKIKSDIRKEAEEKVRLLGNPLSTLKF